MKDDVDEGQVELATLTRLYLFGRYLYRVGDKALGTPINLRIVGWAMLLVPLFWIGTNLIGLDPMTAMGSGLIPRLILPGLVVYLIVVKVTHGAKPHEVALSWTRMAWHQRRRPTLLRPITLHSHTRHPTPPRRRTHA